MRSQIYAWNSQSTSGGTQRWSNANTGNSVSIFIGGFGNNITKPAETTATQFVVIEDVAVSPTAFGVSGSFGTYRGLTSAGTATGANGVYGNRAYIQVRINTTDYFLDPDNVGNDGIPGAASPYPRSTSFQPCFNLYPDVYVLPGQVFDALVTCYQNSAFGSSVATNALSAFMKYTLYDGPDALIANKLLEMGISINPGNVDWYKRTLIQSQSAAPAMA